MRSSQSAAGSPIETQTSVYRNRRPRPQPSHLRPPVIRARDVAASSPADLVAKARDGSRDRGPAIRTSISNSQCDANDSEFAVLLLASPT